jgi:hypothetical protein
MPSSYMRLCDFSPSILDTFEINRERAIDYLNTRDNVYIFDGFAGVSFFSPPFPLVVP